eukprot:m.1075996 g.1075996  ORF g.1075996 m.1075996 type:complete len:85 (-) comp24245_c1_seq7:59-313(-)
MIVSHHVAFLVVVAMVGQIWFILQRHEKACLKCGGSLRGWQHRDGCDSLPCIHHNSYRLNETPGTKYFTEQQTTVYNKSSCANV